MTTCTCVCSSPLLINHKRLPHIIPVCVLYKHDSARMLWSCHLVIGIVNDFISCRYSYEKNDVVVFKKEDEDSPIH